MPAALARALAVVAVQGGASSASRAGWASRARRAVALIVDASMLFVGRSASWSLQAEAGVVPSCHLAECPAGPPPPRPPYSLPTPATLHLRGLSW